MGAYPFSPLRKHDCLPKCAFSIIVSVVAVEDVNRVLSLVPMGTSKSESSNTRFMYMSISLSVTSHKLAKTNGLK